MLSRLKKLSDQARSAEDLAAEAADNLRIFTDTAAMTGADVRETLRVMRTEAGRLGEAADAAQTTMREVRTAARAAQTTLGAVELLALVAATVLIGWWLIGGPRHG